MEGNLPLTIFLLFLIVVVFPGLVIFYSQKSNKKDYSRRLKTSGKCIFKDGNFGVELRQDALTSLIIVCKVYSFKDLVCPKHATEIYKQYRRHNLTEGWWSIRGLLGTLSVLSENKKEFAKYNEIYIKAAEKH